MRGGHLGHLTIVCLSVQGLELDENSNINSSVCVGVCVCLCVTPHSTVISIKDKQILV